MRFPRSTSGRALAATAVVAISAAALSIGQSWRHKPTAPAEAEAPPPPPAPADLEADSPKPVLTSPRADSEIEAQAAHPIQTVVEAEQGDTLLDLLLKAGVDRTEATKAIDALRDVYNPRALKVGQEVTVTFARPSDGIGSGPFDAVVLQPDASRQVSAKRGRDGFSASETKREVTRQLAHFNGTIKGSLFETATAQGVPAPILAEMIRAFSYDVDFQRDLQPGDAFEIMFERFVDKKGQVVRDGNILYANLILSGEAMPIYRYVDSAGTADYYNPKGESVRKALLRTPVDGARISSGFGMRMHPILGFSKMHKGIDFAVATGTPVMAAGAGTIDFAGANGSYGYYVRIKHDAAHSTAYAHLSRFAQGIRVGKRVDQGQTIAFSGSTGRATGPHLHYEVLVRNEQVNPMSIKFQSGNKLAGKELARFQATIKEQGVLLAQTPVTSKVALNKATEPAQQKQ
ncbi:MAG: peptidoglycan DD-metalloendopeptidase family protein [Telmatospirillum sp.]|nr:peptidoglycan DD-metalloendopeptidase family protein [Telmatospirillum sp.]